MLNITCMVDSCIFNTNNGTKTVRGPSKSVNDDKFSHSVSHSTTNRQSITNF